MTSRAAATRPNAGGKTTGKTSTRKKAAPKPSRTERMDALATTRATRGIQADNLTDLGQSLLRHRQELTSMRGKVEGGSLSFQDASKALETGLKEVEASFEADHSKGAKKKFKQVMSHVPLLKKKWGLPEKISTKLDHVYEKFADVFGTSQAERERLETALENLYGNINEHYQDEKQLRTAAEDLTLEVKELQGIVDEIKADLAQVEPGTADETELRRQLMNAEHMRDERSLKAEFFTDAADDTKTSIETFLEFAGIIRALLRNQQRVLMKSSTKLKLIGGGIEAVGAAADAQAALNDLKRMTETANGLFNMVMTTTAVEVANDPSAIDDLFARMKDSDERAVELLRKANEVFAAETAVAVEKTLHRADQMEAGQDVSGPEIVPERILDIGARAGGSSRKRRIDVSAQDIYGDN